MKVRNFLFVFMCFLAFSLSSCGEDEPGGGSQGNNSAENNTTDVAVTGNVTEVGALYAQVNGVVNLNLITASYSKADIGVEFSTQSTFEDKQNVTSKELTGRSFSLRLMVLKPETTYYYRTFVRVSSQTVVYYGEVRSFTTKKMAEPEFTSSLTDVGALYARVDGSVSSDIIAMAQSDIFVSATFSTKSNFVYQECLTVESDALKGKTFSLPLAVLKPETKYYYRLTVKTSSYSYTDELRTFTTKKMTESDTYVDLGLPSGTLWGTINVGANNPYERGSYFAWGETTPKQSYGWKNYKWCNVELWDGVTNYGEVKNVILTKYCTGANCDGETDNKIELELDDDAAYVNFGPKWRMPSAEQVAELKSECLTETIIYDGVSGTLFKSHHNSKSIFIPYAGVSLGGNDNIISQGATYWTRRLNTQYNKKAHCIFDGSSSMAYIDPDERCIGKTVRPVRTSK